MKGTMIEWWVWFSLACKFKLQWAESKAVSNESWNSFASYELKLVRFYFIKTDNPIPLFVLQNYVFNRRKHMADSEIHTISVLTPLSLFVFKSADLFSISLLIQFFQVVCLTIKNQLIDSLLRIQNVKFNRPRSRPETNTVFVPNCWYESLFR